MGINDRDYMKGSDDDVVQLSDIMIGFGKLVVILFGLALFMRLPMFWIKVPLMIVIIYFGWRWLFKPGRKKIADPVSRDQLLKEIEHPKPSQKKRGFIIEQSEGKSGASPKPDGSAVKLLIAYDAAGEFGQAKALIQHLNGKVFPGPDGEEFAVLAGNYFPIKLEPVEGGVRFMLD